jgi:hypothetical protein
MIYLLSTKFQCPFFLTKSYVLTYLFLLFLSTERHHNIKIHQKASYVSFKKIKGRIASQFLKVSTLKCLRLATVELSRGKNFFKNPVYNEPPPYEYMPVRPAHHAPDSMPRSRAEGHDSLACLIGYHMGPTHCKPHLKNFLFGCVSGVVV